MTLCFQGRPWQATSLREKLLQLNALKPELFKPLVDGFPVIAKLSPNSEYLDVAEVCLEAGADALGCANTLGPGLSIDTETGEISGVLGEASAGVHNVTLTATDGTDATPLALEWTVAEVVTVNVPALAPWAVVILALGLLQIGRRRLAAR